MGGNALNFETRRIESQVEFYNLYEKIVKKLSKVGIYGCLIPFYESKESFGDMDILVNKGLNFPDNWTDRVVSEFNPKSTFKNGSCFSFDFEDFQIDLILAPSEEFSYSYSYFAYNDLGNFIGRTAHRLGFKHGHDGLWYTLRDEENPDRVIKEILVTRDYSTALDFLGFLYLKGIPKFNTPEEIFEFAASSKYFDPKQFLLVNRSYAARVRDRKRKMYNGMLEWIRGRWPDLKDDDTPEPVDKEEHLQRAFKQFPEFQNAYNEACAQHQHTKALKQKFNGEFVALMFNEKPTGKELGNIMKELREKIERYNLEQLIIDIDEAQCYDLFYNVLLKNNSYRERDFLNSLEC